MLQLTEQKLEFERQHEKRQIYPLLYIYFLKLFIEPVQKQHDAVPAQDLD